MFILVFILTLLILVIIHELGHFIACKKFNIKVLEFGFGLPPRVWGKKIGETLYSINLLPFGGFVSPLGEDQVDQEILKDKRSFAAQSVWKRITVVIAGVGMNLVLAWILFYTVLIGQGFKIIYPTVEPVVQIGQVENNYPAKEVGIREGEVISFVNNQKVNSAEAVRNIIKNSNGPLQLTLTDLEGKNSRNVSLTPKLSPEGEKRIGVAFRPIPVKEYKTYLEKVFSGISYSFDTTKLTFAGLGKIFTDLGNRDFEKASQSVAGPVGMVVITKNIVEQGVEAIFIYLWFVGILSLTLAIFNVLPIPALDGGRLFFLLVEAITGKKTHAELEKMVHAIGMAVLLTLMLLITYSDIQKFVKF